MPLVTAAEIGTVSPDFIIVGGGTSGLTLAARLTEEMGEGLAGETE